MQAVFTYASCETTSNIGELQSTKSIKMLLLSDELWLIIYVAFDYYCYGLYYFSDANRVYDV